MSAQLDAKPDAGSPAPTAELSAGAGVRHNIAPSDPGISDELRNSITKTANVESIGRASVNDLGGAVAGRLKERLVFWNALVKHGVTVLLVLTITFLTPILIAVCALISTEQRFKEVSELFHMWFSAIAGFAGIAVGFYFKASVEKHDDGS